MAVTTVSQEQLDAFERRMREKEKREEEERKAEIERYSGEVAAAIVVSTRPVSNSEGGYSIEATTSDFPGLVAVRGEGEDAERTLREMVKELVRDRIMRGADPLTGETRVDPASVVGTGPVPKVGGGRE